MRGIANAVTMSKWSPGSNPGLSAFFWKQPFDALVEGLLHCKDTICNSIIVFSDSCKLLHDSA